MCSMLGTLLGAIAALSVANPLQAQSLIDGYIVPAADARQVLTPVKRREGALGIKTSASSVFVADLATGSVLYAKNAHRSAPIASLTKLVTAMTYLDLKPDLNKPITFTGADFVSREKTDLKPGDTLAARDVLRAMLVGSVNSAAYALARSSIGVEAFVEAMNQKTESLALWTPMFFEPSGLDPENQASAADVAAMIAFASGYQEIRDADSMSEVVVKTQGPETREVKIRSTNLLLSSFLNKKPFTIIAAKTGTLPEAGNCMAQVTKNEQGNQVIAVTLGSDTHFGRFQDIKALTAWSFDSYEWR